MEYTIFASKRFIKEFDKLPKDVQRRIKEKLEILKKSPFVGLPLHGSLKGKKEFIYLVWHIEGKYIMFKDSLF